MINSSPRDHRKVRHWRRINWARMPSHFHSICQCGRVAEVRDIAFQGIGEAEGVGTADIGVAGIGRDQLAPEIGGGLPLSHEAMGDDFGGDAAGFGDGADHQALRDADAKFAGDELVPGEALAFVHLAPGLGQRCGGACHRRHRAGAGGALRPNSAAAARWRRRRAAGAARWFRRNRRPRGSTRRTASPGRRPLRWPTARACAIPAGAWGGGRSGS